MSEASISAYYYRLQQFLKWCDEREIDRVDELTGWLIDEYATYERGRDLAQSTIHNRIDTLREFVRYCERIDAVEDGLAESVPVPRVDDEARSSEDLLEPSAALALLDIFRADPAHTGRRYHVYLELAWHTGARNGALRALDRRDYHPDPEDVSLPFVEFVHRPSTGTPLKNGRDGERPVGVPQAVADVVDRYVEQYRNDVHDEHGRAPLLTTQAGRPALSTLRRWAYTATFPCYHTACPHDRDPETCEYRHDYHKQSQCPSSRSPHRIRTGSITWQRDLGIPPEVVAERVNASLAVIQEFYDKADARARLEQRRVPYVETMETSDQCQ